MRYRLTFKIMIFVMLISASVAIAQEPSLRLKDIAQIEGARSNQLVGYGLVVGLDGSGDSQQALFTTQSVVNMLNKFGVIVPAGKLTVKNVAAVMVTADLPPFQRPGSKIDVIVSSLGDAKTLQGGTLLQAPLQGADSNVYAVAQGSISIGGFSAGSGGGNTTKNHPTVGRIPAGAIVERAVSSTLTDGKTINVVLNDPDFETAARIAQAINTGLGAGTAMAKDASTVQVTANTPDLVSLIAQVGEFQVEQSTTARVIVNERTGTVVIGGDVRLSSAAIAHGDLTVEISTENQVSQPQPLSDGKTKVVPQTKVKAVEQPARVMNFQPGATLKDLVRALNDLKVTPRDIIAILQALKQAGALHSEIQII